MARRAWFPSTLAEQAAMFSNVKAKISGYAAVLPLTAPQVTRIELICDIFLAAFEYVEQSRATTTSLVEWRDDLFNGSPAGDPAQAPLAYAVYVPPVGSFIGIFTEFREFRELIVALPGYKDAIGEDLMIVGAEIIKPSNPSLIKPNLTVTTGAGYVVNFGGSMQGYDAIRIEYQRQGSTAWSIIAFGTKFPLSAIINPATPGQPENGQIRAIFIEKNAEFGSFSPNYPVTIS
ncbi:MAG: hypothetical protein ABL999_10620 [Pyrinomonadaceae bacterium]